uniref:Uncharacterized protein n=1 Tax=Rhizophora mucronata TaxID=61149 RepID=A0A2P2PV73_RHIMU
MPSDGPIPSPKCMSLPLPLEPRLKFSKPIKCILKYIFLFARF